MTTDYRKVFNALVQNEAGHLHYSHAHTPMNVLESSHGYEFKHTYMKINIPLSDIFKSRPDRIFAASLLVMRALNTTKDLTMAEGKAVIRMFADDDGGFEDWLREIMRARIK